MHAFLEHIESKRVTLPPVDAAALKYFAVVTMLIDHAAYAFLERAYTADGVVLMDAIPHGDMLCGMMRMVGRQAFPIFCFFLVEGFFYTHSRLRYFGRLVIFAVLSQVPFRKCFFQYSSRPHASVMCTLAIGLLTIWVIEELGNAFLPEPEDAGETGAAAPSVLRRFFTKGAADQASEDLLRRCIFLLAAGGGVLGFARLAILTGTDYSYGGVIMIVVMYLLRDYRITALFISWLWMWWYNSLEMYAAPAFMMLACYSGKRGRQNKYFFYVFYPAHLTVLWLLRLHFFGM